MGTPGSSTPQPLAEMEVAHVLFMDVVGYSKLPIEEQVAITNELRQTVAATPEYRLGTEQKTLICMPTGDGMALAFFSGPEPPVNCAIRIANSLKDHPRIKLRMGVNSGPVYRIPDIKGEPNVAGGGVNFAQRVMDCGDEGHILLSASIADVLRQHGHWAPLIHPLGIAEVKHGEHVSVFNLCGDAVGNPEIPQKLLGKLSIPVMQPTPAPARVSGTPGQPSQPQLSQAEQSSDVRRFRPGDASTLEPPRKQLGDYEVIRELGHGGMGQVYLVRNVISDRLEAMKILLPDLVGQDDLATRFMREIKLLASLDHPNIAQLRTAFTANNQLVMIMEYVEGETLAARLERGAFAPAEALNYITQVLAALSYAHGKGIIHRDIKPANMMLTRQGTVKLMDFGIARSATDVGMTITGATMGSLDYMSPEQVKSEPTDARSDLYSVGVSLYEMATGRRMFAATSSFSVMEAQVKEMPRPPIEVKPSLPQALNDIIMVAIAKNPGQRFQSADAFRNALSQVNPSTAAAAAAGAAAVQPAMTPPPVAPSTPATPVPVPRATPATPTPSAPLPQPGAYATPLPPARSGRHVGWILGAAIVVLVAIFGGTQVYRSHNQNAAMQSAAPTSESQAAPSVAAPQPAVPTSAAEPMTPLSAAPNGAPNAAPQPRPSRARTENQGGNSAQPSEPAPPPGPSPEEIAAQKKLLDDLETEDDQLDSRAAAAESSLDALEQQMHQSGLGMRGDIVAARSNMRTDLAKAKQALDSADTDRARKYLDQANHELEKLEAFLGRR